MFLPGYEKATNLFELTSILISKLPVVESGKYEGVFGVGGLMLAKIPTRDCGRKERLL